MQCPQCQHENSEAAKFCEECGPKLIRTCPGCGHEVSPRAKFCPECGTPLTRQSGVQPPQPPLSYTPKHLAERILAEQAAMEARGATDGERKTITALFADIKDSTALIEDLDPEDARRLIDPALQLMMDAVQMLTLAHEVSHPFSLAWALNWAAISHQFRREGQLAQERAEAATILLTDQGFPLWLALGTILRGWALAEQGQAEEGIQQMRQGLAAYRATGAEIWRPYFFALLTEACGKMGQAEEGLTALAEALAQVGKTEERWYEAELYRLKGELSLQSRQVTDKSKASQDTSGVQSPEAAAEECF